MEFVSLEFVGRAAMMVKLAPFANPLRIA